MTPHPEFYNELLRIARDLAMHQGGATVEELADALGGGRSSVSTTRQAVNKLVKLGELEMLDSAYGQPRYAPPPDNRNATAW
ncbi:MAG: hypothetical protein RLY71_3255 [Pseudomonadota bacterium]|jgi:predicted transcriptional regulator